ncbi:hypothetical protein QOT17_025404 [Balamuthia mandrillaris]
MKTKQSKVKRREGGLGKERKVGKKESEVKRECLPNENHLMEEFATSVSLLTHLPEEKEELLQHFVLAGHDEANDGHQQLRQAVPIVEQQDDPLHGHNLVRDFLALDEFPQLVDW